VADLEHLADELQARMDELKADAETATETVRNVDPDATPVRVPMRKWRALTREKAKLLAQIAHEMGVSTRPLSIGLSVARRWPSCA
jgi:hypothetical protein